MTGRGRAAVTASPGKYLCVLMDVRMPLLDGYAATRAIREHEGTGDRVPIIAMTASAVLGDKEACVEAGMDDFLVKPVGFELLESTLAHWIDGTPSEPSASAAEDGGVLDLDRIQMLQDLRPGDRSLFDKFVATFLERVSDDVRAIDAAVRGGDHVHSSMPPIGSRGARRISVLSGRTGVPGPGGGRRTTGHRRRGGADPVLESRSSVRRTR